MKPIGIPHTFDLPHENIKNDMKYAIGISLFCHHNPIYSYSNHLQKFQQK